ncbi:MAG: hypothetical protein FD155_2710 [Bacteroidetes bacterium]|nr:MAG: hypothetical protein FD155_2710 [Bacteroidota bacterium]
MLMKKIIAYSFILIAGIILLAHDIVPHHHHEKDAIEQSQTYSSDTDKDHHHGFPQHKHQQDDYLFIIRQAFVLSPNLGRLSEDEDECSGNNSLDYYFIHTPIFHYVYTPPDYQNPFGENTESRKTSVTYTFGLRAPPSA